MAKDKFIENQWVDIFPPPRPEDVFDIGLILFITFLAILCLSLLLRYWSQRPRQQALRNIRTLKTELDRPTSDTKACLFRLNAILRHGLAIHQLEKMTMDIALVSDWQSFHHKLSLNQYKRHTPDKETVLELINAAQKWLRRLG